MADLKTDYKDQLLDTSVNTERKFNLVDSDGNVIASGVTLRDITQYSQAGDTFGAADINKITAKINEQNNNLSADGLQFKFRKDGEGNYGFLGADGSLIPFRSGGKLILSVAFWTSLTGCSYSSEYLEQTDWANYKVLKSCKGIAICNGFGITSTGGGGSYQMESGKGNGTIYNPAPIYYFELIKGDTFTIGGSGSGLSIQLFAGCEYGF